MYTSLTMPARRTYSVLCLMWRWLCRVIPSDTRVVVCPVVAWYAERRDGEPEQNRNTTGFQLRAFCTRLVTLAAGVVGGLARPLTCSGWHETPGTSRSVSGFVRATVTTTGSHMSKGAAR
jgi:hypothetical protein